MKIKVKDLREYAEKLEVLSELVNPQDATNSFAYAVFKNKKKIISLLNETVGKAMKQNEQSDGYKKYVENERKEYITFLRENVKKTKEEFDKEWAKRSIEFDNSYPEIKIQREVQRIEMEDLYEKEIDFEIYKCEKSKSPYLRMNAKQLEASDFFLTDVSLA